MQRMTDVLSRMLNDPATRAALCGGGEDSLEGVIDHQENAQNSSENTAETSEERSSEPERVERAPTQSKGTGGLPWRNVVYSHQRVNWKFTDVSERKSSSFDGASCSGTQSDPGPSCSTEAKEETESTELSAPRNPDSDESQLKCKSNVPIETESSQKEVPTSSVQPCSSRTVEELSDVPEEDRSSYQRGFALHEYGEQARRSHDGKPSR